MIVEYLKELRGTLQKILRRKSSAVEPSDPGGGGGGNNSSKHKKSTGTQFFPSSAVAYNPKQRDEKCRICVQLDAEGDTADLYDDHFHSCASGCPRFAGMTKVKKNEIVEKAKLCGQCLDEKFIKTKKNTVHTDCPVNTRKRFYTCVGKDCKKHFWLCSSHSTLNAHKFKSSEKFWSERGKIFANVSIFKASKTSTGAAGLVPGG